MNKGLSKDFIKGFISSIRTNTVCKNIVKALLTVFVNGWIAYFSLHNYKSEELKFDLAAIFIGIILVALLAGAEIFFNDNKDALDKLKNYNSGKLCKYIYTICTFGAIILLLFVVIFEKKVLLLSFLAILLLVIAIRTFNNKLFNVIFEQIINNFVCPIIAYASIIYLVCKVPDFIQNNKIDVDAFKDFVTAFGYLLLSVLDVASIVLVLFIGVVTWIVTNKADDDKSNAA